MNSRVARIGKTYTLEAAHQLPNHDGKCARLHGHSYRVELVLEGQTNGADDAPDEGMVVDFAAVGAVWHALHAKLDHQFLNDVIPVSFHPTTAENIAAYVLSELMPALPQLISVRVWETATGWAEVNA